MFPHHVLKLLYTVNHWRHSIRLQPLLLRMFYPLLYKLLLSLPPRYSLLLLLHVQNSIEFMVSCERLKLVVGEV